MILKTKNIKIEFSRKLMLSALCIFVFTICIQPIFSQLVNIRNNTVVTIRNSVPIKINGSISIGSLSSGSFIQNGNIDITGNWTNARSISSTEGTVTFSGASAAYINGTSQSDFNNILINKSTSGTLVNIDQNIATNNEIAISRGTFRFSNNIARTLTVGSAITISSDGALDISASGPALTHVLNINGDLNNSGSFNLNPSGSYVCNTNFIGSGNSLISGTGATTKFNQINVNKGASTLIVNLNSSNFTAPAGGFLSLTQGEFQINNTFTLTNPIFPYATYTIPTGTALTINNSNVTVSGQNGNCNLQGTLNINAGIYNVGTGTNQNHLLYSTGSILSVSSSLNIIGRLSRNLSTDAISYSQSGGAVKVGTGVVSNSTDRGVFDIGSSSSTFNWTAGTIELQRVSQNSGSPAGDFINLASGNVSNGTILAINSSVSGQNFRLNSVLPVGYFSLLSANNPHATVTTNNFIALDDITLAGTAVPALNSNNLNISLGGNWLNNSSASAFNTGTGRVTFIGAGNDQNIGGTFATNFNTIAINKSGGKVLLNFPLSVSGDIHLISSTALLDIQTYNLTIAQGSRIYSSDGSGTNIDPGSGFSATKCILYSQTGTGGGSFIKTFTSSITSSYYLGIPIGTNGVYSPARIMIYNATVSGTGTIAIKTIPMEHPNVQANNVSLAKYWNLQKTNITFNPPGLYDLLFYYDESEVRGTEGLYYVLNFNSGWTIDPGLNAVVSFNQNSITSERPSNGQFNGDWTAGEVEAAKASYYSIADGNFNSPSSWSKEGYGGSVSTTAPSYFSDRVFIGDGKIITLTTDTPPVNNLEVQQFGTLITSTYLVSGDTFKLKNGGTLKLGSPQGITNFFPSGNIRSTIRYYDTSAIYSYNGTVAQNTGNGLPSVVRALMCENTGATVTLSNNVTIKDSLIINSGTFSIGSNTVNGYVPGRTMIMRGGQFNIGGAFPINYSPPTFTVGTINFTGSPAISIPSSASTPGVLQYCNLQLSGARQYNAITFESAGEIKISGTFTINTITFTLFPTARFLTSGSTIVFNGAGNQNIPRLSGTSGSYYEIDYYNLKLAGSGTKSLVDGNHIAQNNLTIESGSTFSQNTRNLTVYGNWTNNGGTFTPGTATTTLATYAAGVTNSVISLNQPFYNLIIGGPGTIRFDDEASVSSNLTINNGSTLLMTSNNLNMGRNWTNNGTFTSGTSSVIFYGNNGQTFTKCQTCNNDFYNLIINKTANAITTATNSNIRVLNNLTFNSSADGRIISRTNLDSVDVYGSVIRSNLGHVDGVLRLNIPINNVEAFYPIGNGTNYTPITMTLSAGGGTQGLIAAVSQTRTVSLTGSTLNTTRVVNRQWDVTIPASSLFSLGSRTYDMSISFIYPSDVTALPGANSLLFETRNWNGSAWNVPITGTRTNNTTNSLLYNTISAINTFVVGEPAVITFYSIADGSWSTASSWSTARYGGEVAPTAPTSGSRIRIGDGKSIDLSTNFTLSTDTLIVETAGPSNLAGRLNLGTNLLLGGGTFALSSGGILGIGSTTGIATSGSTGNIQTTNRYYNLGSHNNGNFIYYGSAAQITGNGLPSTVNTLTLNNPVRVTLSAAVSVRDSLHIQRGIFDVSTNNYSLSVAGNWRDAGSFNPRAGTVTVNGTANQTLIRSGGESFYNLIMNKSSGILQLASNSDITVSNILTLTSGNIEGRTNSSAVTAASVSRTSGFIDGELRKNIAEDDAAVLTFEVGSSNAYTPVIFNVNGNGGTAGLIGVTAFGYNHPNVADFPLTVDTAKNVQRYWKLSLPPGSLFDLGNSRTYDLTLQFLNPDDIRGGANTSIFVIRQWDGYSWGANTNGTRTATTTQTLDISFFGVDFIVGEPPPQSRIFYTRASGNWGVASNWSTVDYGGAPAAEYPGIPGDVAYIGNSNRIVLDSNRTIGAVTVESVGGQGTLSLGNLVISGNQFVLKRGSKLEIGSPEGITSSGATGNIQTTVRNYNFGSNNSVNFIYNGTSNQASGNGLPSYIASIDVNNPGNTVTLGANLTVDDSVRISAGIFSANNLDINLKGQWINNSSSSAFIAGTGRLFMTGDTNQLISGTQSTIFNKFIINKSGGTVSLGTPIFVQDSMRFNSNTIFVLSSNDIQIGSGGTISGTGLGSSQMLQTDGSATSGRIIKMHASGTGQRNFIFPVGVGTNFNQANIQCNATFVSGSYTALRLRSGIHPNSLNGNMLAKWWNIETNGISAVTASSTNQSFTYQASDVNGTQTNYIPARFNAQWEVNLGTSRSASSSPITVNQEADLDGDWTAGEPGSFLSGRIFYSRVGTGNWNSSASWSNISHSGTAAAYYPGQRFAGDTVIIADNDIINFNTTPITIDTMCIGSTGTGTLRFNLGTNKALTILGSLLVNSNGIMTYTGSGSRYDTLNIYGNLTNNNTTSNAVDFRTSSTNLTVLNFIGSRNSILSGGTGANGYRLSTVTMNKINGLSDTVINYSRSFTNAMCIANNTDQSFSINSGVYRHDNVDTAKFDADGGTKTIFQLGLNSGIDLRRGGIDCQDILKTNTNTTIDISSGVLKSGNYSNEHFYYETGTKFTMTGGEMRCAAGFTRSTVQSELDFNLSGGIIRVILQGCTTVGVYGFDLATASSIFNWSGGTIVITKNSSDVDYKVGAINYNVTGGTLQIGETGTDLTGSGASVALGSPTAPLWNLYVKYTRFSGAMRSAIFYDGDFTILGDVIIDPTGCLDLNTNSFTLAGNFTNNGIFTPDGDDWNSGGGTKKVTLIGNNNQTFNISSAIAATPNNTMFQNEAFFDLICDKPSGRVILGTAANSNLIVRNTLKFSDDNIAIIDARSNNKYVSVISEASGDLAQVQRIGRGHVDGSLWLTIPMDSQNVKFDVGNSNDYTPATFQTVGAGGTSGQIRCITYGTAHPNIQNPPINLDRDIERYWRFSRPSGSFALGGRTYNVDLTFLSSDITNGANWSIFEQFSLFNNTLPWNTTSIGNRTSTTNQSRNNSTFNNTSSDFVIGERDAVMYYTRNNGNWNNTATWSNEGYGGTPSLTYPDGTNHQVYIGDGNTVNLNIIPTVKLAVVENVGNGPGRIDMNENWISGDVFTLSDSCTISSANEYGLRSLQNLGSVRTTNRNFGTSHYIFNSTNLSQTTGDAMPSAVPILSLTINNTSTDSAMSIVYLTNNTDVQQDIHIQKGYLDGGNKTVRLKRDLIIDNGANYNSNLSTFIFNHSTANQNITLNNSWGTLFNILSLSKDTGMVIVGGTSNVNVFAKNRLKFDISNNSILNTRNNNRKAVITNSGIVERAGLGHVDGILQKRAGTGADSIFYEIGYGLVYSPASLILDNSAGNGTAGPVDGVVLTPVPPEPFYGNRMDTVRSVPRYWSLTGNGSFAMGSRKVNVLLQFPASEFVNVDTVYAVIRRKSIPAETYLYTDRRNLKLNRTLASATLAPTETRFAGLGEFYIGNKAMRIFYSINDGNWDNNSNWSFYGFGGTPAPPGEFPNPDWTWGSEETETRDSVIIGNNKSITLNIRPKIALLDLQRTGRLTINDGTYISKSNLFGSNLFVRDSSILNLKTSYGIDSGTSSGVFRFFDTSKVLGNLIDFEFTGALNQQSGNAFPYQTGNVTLNNDNISRIVSTRRDSLLINGNLSILSGSFRPLSNLRNIRLKGNLAVNGILEMTQDSNGSNVQTSLVFQGTGNSDQEISGSGTINLYNMTMNRGTGTGLLSINNNVLVNNILDLREGSNSNNQIVSMASLGNLHILNSDPSAIADISSIGVLRYIRTSVTSGLLIWNVAASRTYLYPIGSFESGTDKYTPFTFTADASGSSGKLGARVSPGQSSLFPGAHLYLPASRTSDYIRRYWAIDSVTTTLSGTLRFDYLQSDVYSNESNFSIGGKWTRPRETAGGAWRRLVSTVDINNNYFQTSGTYTASNFAGDYTLANPEAFQRIFFSRQNGNWNDENSWTYDQSHSGPICGVGVWPNETSDSVVIGHGSMGMNDHTISLNIASVTILGLALGTSSGNSGILDCGPNVLRGDNFTMSDYSTLKIGSPDGISLSGATGNIQTSSRLYTNSGYSSFEYNGTANQTIGNALPATVRNLTINNSGSSGNNAVTFDRNINIYTNLNINNGKLDLQTYSANNSSSSGTLSVSSGATLSLSGTNNLLGVVNNFSSYNFNVASVTEFYGSDQQISSLPVNLTSGLGNVITTNPGTKSVNSSLWIKGNLINQNSSYLQNLIGVDALQVNGNLINSSGIFNNGVIEVGICN